MAVSPKTFPGSFKQRTLSTRASASSSCTDAHSSETLQTSPHSTVNMVKLEEVPDEELFASQQGPKDDEDEWDTDDGTHDL